MDRNQQNAAVAELTRMAKERYEQRREVRERKLADVETKGVLAAAGPDAAYRRALHMTVSEGRVMEARLGATDDLAPINYLGRGMLAARGVCRLLRDGEWFGTGFLVAPGLLLTNNHVIESADEAARFTAEFGREMGLDDRPASPVVTFSLDVADAFVTSPYRGGLDYTFIAVRALSDDGTAAIEDFGWLPMDERTDKILEGEPCVIIQHPLGEPKQICLFGSELVDRPDDHIQYMTDTDHGASGSPVHNRHWQLIGLHHASTRVDHRRRGRDMAVNEGIRVSSIVRSLRDVVNVVPADGISPAAAAAAVLARITDPAVLGDGRPMTLPRRESSATTAPTLLGPPSGHEARATVIGRRDHDHFDSRTDEHFGYKPEFLGGEAPVPLPVLLGALEGDAARLVHDEGEYELKYTHYSAVQSVSRRMPIFTAVNIDGAQSKSLNRKDRKYESRPEARLQSASALALEAAADKWYFDPRIAESAQMTAPIYDETDFAFGHVTRREDPVWGRLQTARMANDDTFYMTNCATQHMSFNSGTWLALENAVLGAARNNRIRVSVFSGPVLLPDDPEVMGIPVPAAFWKIVAWVEGDELRSRAYLKPHRSFVDRILGVERRRLESLPELADQPHEATVADIARVTSLDFGVLVDADELAASSPEARRSRRVTASTIATLSERLSRATRGRDADLDYGGGFDDALEVARDSDDGDAGEARLRRLIQQVLVDGPRLLELLDRGRAERVVPSASGRRRSRMSDSRDNS